MPTTFPHEFLCCMPHDYCVYMGLILHRLEFDAAALLLTSAPTQKLCTILHNQHVAIACPARHVGQWHACACPKAGLRLEKDSNTRYVSFKQRAHVVMLGGQ